MTIGNNEETFLWKCIDKKVALLSHREFMETVFKSTLGQKILVMWDVLVVNGMRQRLNF